MTFATRLAAVGSLVGATDHGTTRALYCHDPDGNNLELFVDTDWYMTQPFLVPLDGGATPLPARDHARDLRDGAGVLPDHALGHEGVEVRDA